MDNIMPQNRETYLGLHSHCRKKKKELVKTTEKDVQEEEAIKTERLIREKEKKKKKNLKERKNKIN